MITHPELDSEDGIHWITTPRFATANTAALAAYRLAPGPLAHVWAGDSASNPTQTVALTFPNAATATAVLTACGAKAPVVGP
jgi:hypothetical protein